MFHCNTEPWVHFRRRGLRYFRRSRRYARKVWRTPWPETLHIFPWTRGISSRPLYGRSPPSRRKSSSDLPRRCRRCLWDRTEAARSSLPLPSRSCILSALLSSWCSLLCLGRGNRQERSDRWLRTHCNQAGRCYVEKETPVFGAAKKEYPQCKSAPPRSSADTTSPVAALTRGGPARNIVPCLRTMMLSSDIDGT